MRDKILMLCQEQGVTVKDFESVLTKLEKALNKRKLEITDDVMIPKEASLSNYHHSF